LQQQYFMCAGWFTKTCLPKKAAVAIANAALIFQL